MINQKNDPNLLYLPKSFENSLVSQTDNMETVNSEKVNKHITELNEKIDTIINDIDNTISIIDETVTNVTKDLNNKADLIDNYDILYASNITELMSENEVHPEVQQVFENENTANRLFRNNKFLNTSLFSRLKSDEAKDLIFYSDEWNGIKSSTNSLIDNEETYDTIVIPMNSRENIKVLDFILNYKQKPIVTEELKDTVLEIHKYIEGRFYIIRDTVNKSLIVKTMVKNSDNEMYTTESTVWDNNTQTYSVTNGPEFNIDFIIINDSLMMVFKNFKPYKWNISRTLDSNSDQSLNTENFSNVYDNLQYNNITDISYNIENNIKISIECDLYISDKIGHMYNSIDSLEKQFIVESGYTGYMNNDEILKNLYLLTINKKGLISYDLPLKNQNNINVKDNEIIKYSFTNYEKLSDGSYSKISSIEDIRQQLYDVLFNYYQDHDIEIEKILYNSKRENISNFKLINHELYDTELKYCFCNIIDTSFGMWTYVGEEGFKIISPNYPTSINRTIVKPSNIPLPDRAGNTASINLIHGLNKNILPTIGTDEMVFSLHIFSLQNDEPHFSSLYTWNNTDKSLSVFQPNISIKETYIFKDSIFGITYTKTDKTAINYGGSLDTHINCVDQNIIYRYNTDSNTFIPIPLNGVNSLSFNYKEQERKCFTVNDTLYFTADSFIFKYDEDTNEFNMILNVNNYIPNEGFNELVDPEHLNPIDLTGFSYKINDLYQKDNIILMTVLSFQPDNISLIQGNYIPNVYKFNIEDETITVISQSDNTYNTNYYNSVYTVGRIQGIDKYGILFFSYFPTHISSRYSPLEYSQQLYSNRFPLYSSNAGNGIYIYNEKNITLDIFSNLYIDPNIGLLDFDTYGIFTSDLITKDILKIHNNKIYNDIFIKTSTEKETGFLNENLSVTKTNINKIFKNTSDSVSQKLIDNFNNYDIIQTGYGIFIKENNNLWYLENPERRKNNELRVLPLNKMEIINLSNELVEIENTFICESNYGMLSVTTSNLRTSTSSFSRRISLCIYPNNEIGGDFDSVNGYQIFLNSALEFTVTNIQPTFNGIYFISSLNLYKICSIDIKKCDIITLTQGTDYPFYKYIEEYNDSVYCISVNKIYEVPYTPLINTPFNEISNPLTFEDGNTLTFLTVIRSTSKGLFLGTGSGLYKYNDDLKKFELYGLSNNIIYAIKENPDTGDIFITSGEYDINISDTYIEYMNYNMIPHDQDYIYNLKKSLNRNINYVHTWWVQDTVEKCDNEISFYEKQFMIVVEENRDIFSNYNDRTNYFITLQTLENNSRILKDFCLLPMNVSGGENGGWANRVPVIVKETSEGLFVITYSINTDVTNFKQKILKYNKDFNQLEEYSSDLESEFSSSKQTWYDTITETDKGIFFLDSYNRNRIYTTNLISINNTPKVSKAHYIQLNDTNFRNYQYSSVGITPPVNWQKFKLKGNNLSNKFGHKAYITSNSYLNLNTLESQEIFTNEKLISKIDGFDPITFTEDMINVGTELNISRLPVSTARNANYLSHFMCTNEGVFALEVFDKIQMTPTVDDTMYNISVPISLYYNGDPLNTDVFKKIELEFVEDVPENYETRTDMLFKVFKDQNILFSDEFVKGFHNTSQGLFYGKHFSSGPSNWDESSCISYPERNITVWKFDKVSMKFKQYIITQPIVVPWNGYTTFFKELFGKTYLFVIIRIGSGNNYRIFMYEYNDKYDIFNYIVSFENSSDTIEGTALYLNYRDFIHDCVIGYKNKIFINYFNWDIDPKIKLFQSYDIKTKKLSIYNGDELTPFMGQLFIHDDNLYCTRTLNRNMLSTGQKPFDQNDYVLKYDNDKNVFIKDNSGSQLLYYYATEFGTLTFNNMKPEFENGYIGTYNNFNYYNNSDSESQYIERLKYNFNIITPDNNLNNLKRTNILNLFNIDLEYRYINNYDIRYGHDSKGKPYLYVIGYNDLFNTKYYNNNLSLDVTPDNYQKYMNYPSVIMKYNMDKKIFEPINDTDYSSTYGRGNENIEDIPLGYNPQNKYYDNACTENFYVFDDIELWINSNNYPYHTVQFRKPYTISKEYSNEHRFNGFYNLTLTGLNQEEYNNLETTDTSFSNIDKLVITENGSINLLRTKDNDYSQNYIKQYYEFKNYYPYTKNLLLSENEQNDVSTYIHKEDYNINSIKSYIKNIYFGHTRKNLSNRRFFKSNNILTNGLSHNTNMLLGDLENIIKDNIVFKIDLEIYPFNLKSDENNGYENRYKWFTDGYHPDKFFDWSHKK